MLRKKAVTPRACKAALQVREITVQISTRTAKINQAATRVAKTVRAMTITSLSTIVRVITTLNNPST